MKYILISILTALTLSNANAQCSKQIYSSLSFGVVKKYSVVSIEDGQELNLSNGYMSSISIGCKFTAFRFEGEIYDSKNRAKSAGDDYNSTPFKGSLYIRAILINAFWDFKFEGTLSPFIGLGVGKMKIQMNNITDVVDDKVIIDGKDTAFTYQFIFGITYTISANVSIKTSYRYMNAKETSFDSSRVQYPLRITGPKQHTIDAGVYFQF